MGKEVILQMLEERHGLHAEDMLNKPGPYMSALRDILGESCELIEVTMLDKIQEDTGLRDWNLESTVELLKKNYR
jgi:hypothetical protein